MITTKKLSTIYTIAALIFGLLTISFYLLPTFIATPTSKAISPEDIVWLQAQEQLQVIDKEGDNQLVPFNPNHLTLEDWKKLGFSEKQSISILKYKKSLGGFSTKEQIQKCFVINDYQYNRLQSFLYFDSSEKYQKNENYESFSFQKKKKATYFIFDPNRADEKTWEKLGFSPKQTAIIIKYRNGLQGFSSLEEIENCFVIGSDKFNELRPYIRLSSSESTVKKHHLFNPNTSSESDWINEWGLSANQVATIFKYKAKLGGFKKKEEIQACYVISNEKYNEMAPYLVFELKNSAQVLPYEKTNNINRTTVNQLVIIGINEREAKRIINYREKNSAISSIDELSSLQLSSQTLELIQNKLVFK